MRAVVTGVAGFIGSTLAQRLLDDGAEVIGVDAFTPYYEPEVKRRTAAQLGHERFRLIEADLAMAALEPLLDGADVVFHLAGQPGVRLSWGEGFTGYASANVVATERVLSAARAVGVSRVVYASSSSVYGEQIAYPVSERALPRPHSPYGVSKLAGEHLCAAYADNFGLSTVSLRLFTVYGPRQRPDMAFTKFIRAALSGDVVTVNGSGDQVRDFTFVDDVVEAFVSAATANVAPGSVFNVAGGSSATVRQTIDLISGLVGPVEVVYGDHAPGDVARTGALIDRARDSLGWAPRIPLPEGLARQVTWMSDGSRR